jgi:hypothetical protein
MHVPSATQFGIETCRRLPFPATASVASLLLRGQSQKATLLSEECIYFFDETAARFGSDYPY